jgi:predicted tellurium resistance membrane protein TerC
MHVPRGYIYAAIGFSILVEMLNILTAGRGPEFGGGRQSFDYDKPGAGS